MGHSTCSRSACAMEAFTGASSCSKSAMGAARANGTVHAATPSADTYFNESIIDQGQRIDTQPAFRVLFVIHCKMLPLIHST